MPSGQIEDFWIRWETTNHIMCLFAISFKETPQLIKVK